MKTAMKVRADRQRDAMGDLGMKNPGDMSFSSEAERWQALVARDERADRTFLSGKTQDVLLVAHFFFSFLISKIIQRVKGSRTAAADQPGVFMPSGIPSEA
jgi:hypothetical protein